ncbi:MAG: homocysteine S-methyltransferase family protein [Lentisphaerae bacterium]|nr:homocysteine S-methyltransferase family protein [Lentisphaerota bacterium]
MKKIIQKLRQEKILVSDGAWGTSLQEQGLQPGECPELWNVDHRERVLDVARGYVEAGSDLVLTNSFGANRFKLGHYALAGRTAELNRAAAGISREAAGEAVLVLGSVGPTGKILLMGDVSPEELYEAFAEQVVALRDGGADAICVETMSAIDEATIAVKAARENTDLEVVCTFTFEKTVQGEYRTMMGVSPEDMAKALVEAGADIIGTNCGNGMVDMAAIVTRIRAVDPETPVLVHANAGHPVRVDGSDVFPETPEQMQVYVADVIQSGADIVGGCCGTTPAHIRAIADVADEVRNKETET